MKRRMIAGALVAFGLAGPPAQAATQEIKGRDTLDWDRPYLAIAPGDTVRWTFDGTQQAHNVQPQDGAGWMGASPLGTPAAPWEHTFATEGVYTYLCIVHATTMRGTIEVTRTPEAPQAPPPPPPLSQQPFANDAIDPLPADTAVRDRQRPTLSAVSVRLDARGGLRVRFRVSELSTVSVTIKRGGRIATRTATSGTGPGTLTVRDRRLTPGRYRVEVRATDVAGNRSPIRGERIDIPNLA